jgi:hypothetical protein
MKWFVLSLGLLAASLVGQAASADSEGEAGRLVAVEVLTADSDVYAQRHGRIVVEESLGKEERVYLLGGVSMCPNQDVSDAQIDMLARAAGNPKLVIKPFYKTGNGSSRCLVGFVLGGKKQVAGITQ